MSECSFYSICFHSGQLDKILCLKGMTAIILENIIVIFYCFRWKAMATICIKLLHYTLVFFFYFYSCCQELIQNAEDAGATEVRFLYDETQYGTETLWSKDMAQYQGKYTSYWFCPFFNMYVVLWFSFIFFCVELTVLGWLHCCLNLARPFV